MPDNLPDRNEFFTGREAELEEIEECLARHGMAVLGGVSGTGKTQTAVEFAHRQRGNYAVIYRLTCETPADVASGLAGLAGLLGLPSTDVLAAQQWLADKDGWLLLLEDADDNDVLHAIASLLPKTRHRRIIVTSRRADVSALGVSEPIELRRLPVDEAVAFLCKRTGRGDVAGDELDAVVNLSLDLACFPLALELAGAFLRSGRLEFAECVRLYRERRERLPTETLKQMPSGIGEFKEPLAITCLWNFEQVESASAASADLLRCVASLPDGDIQLQLITAGASELGEVIQHALERPDDSLALAKLLEPARCYSLIEVQDERRVLSMHRLVQRVLRGQMDEATRRAWSERALRLLSDSPPPAGSQLTPVADEPREPTADAGNDPLLTDGASQPVVGFLRAARRRLFRRRPGLWGTWLTGLFIILLIWPWIVWPLAHSGDAQALGIANSALAVLVLLYSLLMLLFF